MHHCQRMRTQRQSTDYLFDTNVWISRLLLADSVSARAVDKALAQFEVVVSESSVEELADVLSAGEVRQVRLLARP